MSKKPKRAKRKTGLYSQTALVDKWLNQASNQVFQEDYVGAVDTCQRLLNYLPQKAHQRAEALYYLATAQSLAEKAFQRVIGMGDCLPQPWGNIGTCLIMQARYDEAEAALKRALKIDPRYAIAKQNLALLPETRRTGPPKMVGMLDPFKGTKLKQEITFVVE